MTTKQPKEVERLRIRISQLEIVPTKTGEG